MPDGDLLSRTGMSEPVMKQAHLVDFSWKHLLSADIPMIADLLPTCAELRELDLSHNNLGDAGAILLASCLHSACKSLEIIRLTRNGITGHGCEALARFLSDAKASSNVKHVDLSLNALHDDSAIGAALATNTSLVDLDLSSNALRGGQSIAQALNKNRTLARVHLLYNPLDVQSALALAAAIRTRMAIGVELSLCNIDPDAECVLLARRGMRSSDAILLAAELETARCVRVLDLSHNMLGPEAASALASALRCNSTLTNLKLQSNRLAGSWLDFGDEVGIRDDSGVASFASSLADGNTLTALDLSQNTLGEAGAVALAAAVAHAREGDPLRWLHVGQSGGEALPVQPLRGIAVRGEVHSTITLAGKRLDDLDAVVISTLIATNSRLQVLDLSGSIIGEVGCNALARALLSPDCRLTELDLRGKGMLGEAGKRAIGEALSRPGSAQVGCLACDHFFLGPQTAAVDLAGAMLSPADVILLAGVLHHNRALLSLDLSSNGLGPATCVALCAALARNTVLIELDVYGNELSDEGARLFAATLKTNSALTALSLGLNGISGEGVRRMCHALESNSSLVALSLENNGASTFTEVHASVLLDSNRRRAAIRRHLPGARERSPGSRLHVHLCGEPGSGKTSLAGALRRSGVGQKAGEEAVHHTRTRGIVESTQRYESRVFVVTDYGGKSEFALMHHRHHDRNARELMPPAVYVIVVNLMSGFDHCAAELRWWRRYLRAVMPRGTVPPVCLIGSRADRCAKPNQILLALREHANYDGTELPEIVAAHAFDCRGAAWPLRDWYVQQHDAQVGAALPVPRVIESVLTRKEVWAEKHKLRSLGWGDYCTRLRREIRELANVDEHALRAITSYLHDMNAVLLVDEYSNEPSTPPATSMPLTAGEASVILDVPWFYSSIVNDLLLHGLRGGTSASSIGDGAYAVSGAAPGAVSGAVSGAVPGRDALPVLNAVAGVSGTSSAALMPYADVALPAGSNIGVACNAALSSVSAAADRTEAEAVTAVAEAELTLDEAALVPVYAEGADTGVSNVSSIARNAAAMTSRVCTARSNGGEGDSSQSPEQSSTVVGQGGLELGLSATPVAIARRGRVDNPSAPTPGGALFAEGEMLATCSSLSLNPSQLAARCRAAAALGEDAPKKLVRLLCELGLCCPVYDDAFPRSSDCVSFLVAPPLSSRESRQWNTQAMAPTAAELRCTFTVQVGRRFVGRSPDDMLHVPSLLSLLYARAAQEPAAREEPDSRQMVGNDAGRLLLSRHGACCILQKAHLADGRDAVDVFACAHRAGALPYSMLNDALDLLRLCLAECAPGVQLEHHAIGASGLDESMLPDMRPTAPIGVVRAACKAGKRHIHFGGANQLVSTLLGGEETRQILALARGARTQFP